MSAIVDDMDSKFTKKGSNNRHTPTDLIRGTDFEVKRKYVLSLLLS